jgi:hypothetical protein
LGGKEPGLDRASSYTFFRMSSAGTIVACLTAGGKKIVPHSILRIARQDLVAIAE